jgi:DNA uptake protein ComE-like DNA-binding protein
MARSAAARRAEKPDRSGVRRSWWVLLTLVPLGLTAWGALVYAGVRARRPLWTAFGIVYLAGTAVGFALAQVEPDGESTARDVAGGVLLLSWAAAFVHALAIRSAYLERTDLFEGERFDRAEDLAMERAEARRIARADPGRARELGIGRPDLAHAFDGGLVDVNSAPVSAIARLPGVDDALARRIVEVREDVNGFSSLEDMGLVLSLDAHTLDGMRAGVVFLPRGTRA